jgi:hypothetical protein
VVRRAARTDRNQPEIVAALRAAGVTVCVTSHVGGGFPDLAASYRKRLIFLEVKDGSKPPSARKLTPAEAEFHRDWADHVAVVESVDQALAAVGVVLG